MLLFSVISAAVAPGLSLLTYLYLRDKYEAEPIHMVIRVFLLGILLVIPILVLQRGIELWLGDGLYVQAFIQSAGIEESIKWFVLFHLIYNHTEFDEPYDGILYAGAISLGFATLENILYSIFMPADFSVMFLRALLPVSGHALFGVLMGYYLGRAKFSKGKERKLYLGVSLLAPILLHGAYDWIILVRENDWIFVIIPFMILLWIFGLSKMKSAHLRSPFRYVRSKDEVNL
ncbi:glutamic-type intramembrane protease PrsW [Paenibacillus endoradicis]|uniref:glutamic-type intramembrane protease PrsW n=1 Tax=Paenibacillus endoradicis TaxID=2972487 RepID=UPI002159276B|nr:glutamic-type intramembrane protease PrsW [Paenibacillus endoradicis]MCR8660323.1 glutamic-type intramembrane protease PrsW [Paenibacillus endoradicis]